MKKIIPRRIGGFTLIELLIVVAIIAILAAIAVPNFLEAQMRAKVSRVKADHRTIATGLETYHIDTNAYPLTNYDNRSLTFKVGGGFQLTLERLTTPISYLTGEGTFTDPFDPKSGNTYYRGPDLDTPFKLDTSGDERTNRTYWYTAWTKDNMKTWSNTGQANSTPSWYFLESAGPDRRFHLTAEFLRSLTVDNDFNRARTGKLFYDASNGTVSRGSIWRGGGAAPSVALPFYHLLHTYN